MEEILHQLIGSLSHYLQGSMHPRWCRISSIISTTYPTCEKQRAACGQHFADVTIGAVEPDGNELRWIESGAEQELTLRGSYTTLRPRETEKV